MLPRARRRILAVAPLALLGTVALKTLPAAGVVFAHSPLLKKEAHSQAAAPGAETAAPRA